MNSAEAGIDSYMVYLKSLRDFGAEYFLEGGQAVNFWAEYIDAHNQDRPLSRMRPFTSKDCDIWVSHKTWKVLKCNSTILKGTSPIDGQLGILPLSQEPPLFVDFLQSVYGIDASEYPRLCQRALDDGTVRVIDPVYLFLSKCHCFLHLPQADRQDERHIRIMAIILPEYFSMLIADSENAFIAERDLIKEIKLFKKILTSGPCRRTLQRLKIDPHTLIPWKRMEKSNSPHLRKYGNSQVVSASPKQL